MKAYTLLFFAALFNHFNKPPVVTRSQPSVQPIFQDQSIKDSIVRNGYTLIFTNNAADFASDAGNAVKAGMIEAFFKVYPQEAAIYNPNTLRKVYFLIDPNYTGVAEAGNGQVRFNSKWMLKAPTDMDVVTHEVMHIVQAYDGNNPGWLVEGIADFARYKFGVDNKASGWTLPVYSPNQSYTNSYRITARFLVWVETKVKKGTVKKLDSQMRDHSYTADTWKKLTGKTVDELWKDYSANPAI